MLKETGSGGQCNKKNGAETTDRKSESEEQKTFSKPEQQQQDDKAPSERPSSPSAVMSTSPPPGEPHEASGSQASSVESTLGDFMLPDDAQLLQVTYDC